MRPLFPSLQVSAGYHTRVAAIHHQHRHLHRVLRDVGQERAGEAVQQLAQLGVVLRLLVVQRHGHPPQAVVERRVHRVLLQQLPFQLLTRQLLRRADDGVARGRDDDGRAGRIDDVVHVGQAEPQVGTQVWVVERLQDVRVYLHLAMLVERGLLEETLRHLQHVRPLADGARPQAHLLLLLVSHLARHTLHLPQGRQGQHDSQRQHYQFQLLFHHQLPLTSSAKRDLPLRALSTAEID